METDPSAHTDVDRSEIDKLPTMSPGAGLSDAITYTSGAVAADANGSFHPSGDHAQVSYVIDGQVISDQQSKTFSTQLPTNALQSMELITGSPEAEFGDKSTMVVNAVTRSGLGSPKSFRQYSNRPGLRSEHMVRMRLLGLVQRSSASFSRWMGFVRGVFWIPQNFFLSMTSATTNVFLTVWITQPSGTDTIHLDLFTARKLVPGAQQLTINLRKDQRQRVLTWNVAPGYQHTFNASTLLTVNPFARRDQVDYYGSRNPFDDTPGVRDAETDFLRTMASKRIFSHVLQEPGPEITELRFSRRASKKDLR